MIDAYFGAGRVGLLTVKLFTADKFNRMLESTNLADAIKVLYESNYGEGMVLASSEDFEKLLSQESQIACQFLKELSSDEKATDCFLMVFDYDNAKILAKSKYLRKDSLSLCYVNGLMDAKEMAQKIVNDDYEGFPVAMQEALNKIDTEFFEGNRTGELVDLLLDKAMYKDVLSKLKKCKTKSVVQYFKCEIDTKNILTLLRTKRADLDEGKFAQMFLDGGNLKQEWFLELLQHPVEKWEQVCQFPQYKELLLAGIDCLVQGKSLYQCEQLAEKYKVAILVPNKDKLTIEPVICWYLSKMREIDNVRMILVGISCGIEKTRISERLKVLYV